MIFWKHVAIAQILKLITEDFTENTIIRAAMTMEWGQGYREVYEHV